MVKYFLVSHIENISPNFIFLPKILLIRNNNNTKSYYKVDKSYKQVLSELPNKPKQA